MVPTLRELALISDGCRGALVGPGGEIGWACFPLFDGGGIFNSLLGGSGGFRIAPEGRFVWGGYYEDGTLIWRTRWVLDDGSIVECREALAYPGRPDKCVLLRRVEARRGTGRITARLDVRPAFDREEVRWSRRRGLWEGRGGGVHARWSGATDAHRHALALEESFVLEAGGARDYMLEISLHPFRDAPPDPIQVWRTTASEWTRAVPSLRGSAAPHDARHAAAVLLGLTSPGGGMVAAATTSLPERANRGGNYDYRYVWIRDQCYAGLAAAAAGLESVLDAAVRFVSGRLLADGASLKPVYTTSGTEVPHEVELAHLPGYPGGQLVKVGNHAGRQFQLDSFGESLLLLAAAARGDRLDSAGWRAAEVAANAIEERWNEPGAGIWETEPAHWTHSRLVAAAGLKQAAAAAPGPGVQSRWLALADLLIARTGESALSAGGRWQRAQNDERVDAALLIPALRGAIPASDPRSRETLTAVVRELGQHRYCYRYRAEGRPLGEAEGAFNLCNFWVALAYLQQGDTTEAGRWFERARSACGPPGLFAEEFDVTQRQLRGNLPQAFVHAELLETAVRLGAEA